jgi:hypothetical protein
MVGAILARKVYMDADDLEGEVTLAAQEGSEPAEKAAGRPVRWANPILQKRAWSNAWLALLAVTLPEAILRKVRAGMNHIYLDFASELCTIYPGSCRGPSSYALSIFRAGPLSLCRLPPVTSGSYLSYEHSACD